MAASSPARRSGRSLAALLSLAVPGAAPADVEQAEAVRANTALIMAAYGAGMAAYGYNAWWRDHSGGFETVEEGWFGQNTYRGGADKFGHAFTTYASTRLLGTALAAAGNPETRARRLAAGLVGVATLAVEVLDGYTEGIGFSAEDVALDLAGIGLALLMEARPDLDARYDFRLHYAPSAAARALHEHDPIEDYSGQTYLLVVRASGFEATRRAPVLRYLELAAGYGARGYKPRLGTEPRQRYLYLGLSLDLAALLNGLPPSRGRQAAQGALEYVQVPGTLALGKQPL